MNYEEMNNHQINKRVARALGIEWIAVAQDGLIVDGQSTSVDYCNNPSDAWPIIFDSGMSIWQVTESDREIGMSYATGDWGAYCVMQVDGESNINSDGFEALDSNPLRAAMICFLKMKDAENGNN